jgi:hypothetical protein
MLYAAILIPTYYNNEGTDKIVTKSNQLVGGLVKSFTPFKASYGLLVVLDTYNVFFIEIPYQ